MVILDRQKIFTNEDISAIENRQLEDILACRTIFLPAGHQER